MRALIVSASPRVGSLTELLADTAAKSLLAQGFIPDVLDLNRMSFDPVVGPIDYGVGAFSKPVGEHASDAWASGFLSAEVKDQQARLSSAQVIVFVFPLWWAGMPAILKGWVDRVFTEGFAYGLRDADGNPRKYGDGAFAGKRALIITSTGERASAFTGRGVNGGIDDLLFPINHGIFWYTGMEVLAPIALLGVDTPVWQGNAAAVDMVRRRMESIKFQRPLRYRRMLDDYDDARVLLPTIRPGEHGLSIHRS